MKAWDYGLGYQGRPGWTEHFSSLNVKISTLPLL